MSAVLANWVSELRLKFTGGKCRLGKNRSTEAFIFQAMKKHRKLFKRIAVCLIFFVPKQEKYCARVCRDKNTILLGFCRDNF